MGSVAFMLFLILRLRIHAFLSLLMTSIFLGFLVGMPMDSIIKSVIEGMGSTLGYVAIIIGIGAIFGQMLESSKGAESLAQYLIKKFGKKNAPYSLATTGFIIATPVFFDVGFIILVPILYAMTRESKKSLLYFSIPLLAGLAVAHAFIPPTPGPLATAAILGVDLGWVLLFGILIGIPVTLLAGPIFGKYISKKIVLQVPNTFEATDDDVIRKLPSFSLVLAIILVPIVLIIANTVSNAMGLDHFLVRLLSFVGHPIVALLIATLIAIYALGVKRGFTPDSIFKLSAKALAPAGIIILVTGAGGVFKQLIVDSGIGMQLAESMAHSALPPLVLAYVIAMIMRVSQGSATVAMLTSAAIVSPLLSSFVLSEPHKALVVISIAAGATMASHVNDSGFWIVGKYLGMNEKQTLQSWTVMTSIISVSGFSMALILSFFF